MGIIENLNNEEQKKQELWDKLGDYKALGMTEDDVDMTLLYDEDE